MARGKKPAEEIESRVIAMLKRKAWEVPVDTSFLPDAGGLSVRLEDEQSKTYWTHPVTGEEVDIVIAAKCPAYGPDPWRILTGQIGAFIRDGKTLPEQYREFAASLVFGSLSAPKHRSHKDGKAGPFKLERRDFAICVGMAALSRAGYALENGARGLKSASEVVANEVDGIEAAAAYAIWRKNKKRFSETLLWERALERLCTGSDEHSGLMQWFDKVDAKRKR